MTWTIDHVIFLGFLAFNLVFGFISSRGITNIRQYALSDRNFNTATISYTIIATWIGGTHFLLILNQTYINNFYVLTFVVGDFLNFLLLAYFFIPRMADFLGKLSIAEAMKDIYGNKVGLVTSISGLIGVGGLIAIQLKLSGVIFNYALGINELYGIIITGLIISTYSAIGGIKAVTYTDVLQIFTFGVVIPIISFSLYYDLQDTDRNKLIFNLTNNFSFKNYFPDSEKNIKFLLLLPIFAIPGFNPAIFQRISMAKNVYQSQRSFYISAFYILIISLFMVFISLFFKTINPNLEQSELLEKIIFYPYIQTILKSLFLIGLTAMIMSTVDSYINASSLLIHNLYKKNLLFIRTSSFVIGIFSIGLSLYKKDLLDLIIFTASFYMPIVTIPFIMVIIGYRTPYEKAVLWGMGAGLSVVLLWNYLDITVIDNIVPAMLANLFVLVFMHYYYHNRFLKNN